MSNVEGGGEFTISGVENVSESFFYCVLRFSDYITEICVTLFLTCFTDLSIGSVLKGCQQVFFLCCYIMIGLSLPYMAW